MDLLIETRVLVFLTVSFDRDVMYSSYVFKKSKVNCIFSTVTNL